MKFLSIILLGFFSLHSFSQARFYPEESQIAVQGTSTLHDWESLVIMEDVKVELHIEDTDPMLLGHLRMTIPTRSIKSGENIMDNKTYDALKADVYPVLNYEVEVFEYLENEVVASDGILKVAGTERKIPVKAKYSKDPDGQKISFTGSVSFKMTDFKVSPPTAVFGTIKTGDEVTIEYKIIVENI
ncbi:MAG: YceI family protein [Cyclobacteriaceae bacterium]